MKVASLLAVTAATACVLSAGQARAFGIGPTCQSYFAADVVLGIPHAPEATGQWRAALTNAQITGNVAPTSQAREEFINRAMGSQLTFLNSHRDTPEMVFVQAEGVQVSVPSKEALTDATMIPLAYIAGAAKQTKHYDEIPRLHVTGLGPTGVLKGTLLLPVSGHTGLDNANKWAKTDLYKVVIADAQGRETGKIVVNAPSKGVITIQELEVQMVPGQAIQIQYARNGSLGVGGYAEGRVYEIVWDGK
ncbi:MAG: hypothetical protein V4760_04845 [Bdellovibrionota bacterium]